MPSDCRHEQIEVFRDLDGGPGRMWACCDCHRRLYPACPICVTIGHRDEAHVEPVLDEERLARALRRLRDEPPHGSLVRLGLLPLYSDLAPWEDAGNWESPFARILAKAYREDSDA